MGGSAASDFMFREKTEKIETMITPSTIRKTMLFMIAS
jgi:hypothetical protein